MKKQRWEESEKRREEERRSEKRKSQKKEDAGARKGRKVTSCCVFQMFCGSGGSKSRLAKAAGEEPSGEMRDEKLHAVVARSKFRSQNAQSTPFSEHFWKLRCSKRGHFAYNSNPGMHFAYLYSCFASTFKLHWLHTSLPPVTSKLWLPDG